MEMRFMVIVRATEASEADVMPSRELLEAMGTFNERMAADGMIVSAEGLKSSRAGARIAFGDGAPRVKRGPFAPAQSLIAGFWLIEAKSLDEVVAALERFGAGSYGVCEVCGKPIGEARLEAMPAARFCIVDAAKQ